MARRWVNLQRYGGAELLVVANCPPHGRNFLYVKGYSASDLSRFGFEPLPNQGWLLDSPSFKTRDLVAWFDGFDPRRDIVEMDPARILIGFEDLDLPVGHPLQIAAGGAARVDELDPTARRVQEVLSAFQSLEAAPRLDSPALATLSWAGLPDHAKNAYSAEFALPGQSRDAIPRLEALLSATQSKLEADVARYESMRTQGLAVISSYDVDVVYQGDPVLAVRQLLLLKAADIDAGQRKLVLLAELREQAFEALGREQGLISSGEVAGEAGSSAPFGSGAPEVRDAESNSTIPLARRVKSTARQIARIEDAGEKIGGARKDFYAKSMRVEDLEGMNDREQIELVTKDNIWPRRSLAQHRELGVHCHVALFVNALRRDLPAGIRSTASAQSYIETVTRLRDIAEAMKIPSDIATFQTALADAELIYIEHGDRYIRTSVAPAVNEAFNGALKALHFVNDYLINPDRGARLARKTYESKSYRLGNEYVNPRGFDSDQYYDFLAQLQARTQQRAKQTRESRKTDEDDSQTGVNYLERPHLQHIVRDGAPEIRGGRDVKPEDFLGHFGFRACEFGNWLPDIERQDVLNRAYDSLTTLSEVLGLKPQELSLRGTLAVAFGSRGVGRAAAHYETSRKVINLTRFAGAGSVAHEWFHALDDAMCEWIRAAVAGQGYRLRGQDTYFATELFLGAPSRKRERSGADLIAQTGRLPAGHMDLMPLLEFVNSMTVRHRTLDEEHQILIDKRERYFTDLVGCFRSLILEGDRATPNKDLADAVDPLVTLFREEIETLQKSFPLLDQSADHVPSGRSAKSGDHPLLKRAQEYACRNEATGEPTQAAAYYLDGVKTRIEHIQSLTRKIATLPQDYAATTQRPLIFTRYLEDARKLDDGRSKMYWSTVRELGARAFETYVQGEIESRGWRDDYLVHGTEESRFTDAPESPYPVGVDRQAIAAKLAPMLEMVRQKFGLMHRNESTEMSDAEPHPSMEVAEPAAARMRVG